MNIFAQDDFNQQYELAKRLGDKRFGSECQHTQTRNGQCLDCFRKVMTTVKEKRSQEPYPLKGMGLQAGVISARLLQVAT